MMAQISNGVNLKMEAIFKLVGQLITCLNINANKEKTGFNEKTRGKPMRLSHCYRRDLIAESEKHSRKCRETMGLKEQQQKTRDGRGVRECYTHLLPGPN